MCRENGFYFYFPVSDNCTIGRDPFSIMLPRKEVFRPHNMLFFSEGKVIIETVTKIKKVWIIVNQGEGASTSEGRHCRLIGERKTPEIVSDEVVL